ncbi:nitrogenase cofactor biosynthesis protein NifB [Paenibacillus sp. S150]|uniref:nitrogenase cofactor biosynthesis protein NifB n=1 Tax=Paenibacillus sp. S150 TaxID=2749826 RepID=UPI001C589250|nr:nitrogenase cofactor biosynthesis protein NifB [Paenibacillus sp. S150]MBW4080352.1 nitrogenase cofactor biosynthesis protein NifB [Paenibacillus sp. S150]
MQALEGVAKLQNPERHPCYDELAHEVFARMHVAVAPKCNINCNYCNIKYDCVSESRPGVVSRVLSPEEAYAKVQDTLRVLPQLTVVGIAGPGDPLANPVQTFETFRLLSREMPDLQLCLSTNGLKLPDYVEEIVEYGIQHVTVTMNAVDPAVGGQIYHSIYYRGKAYRGEAGAEILISRQLEGIRAVAALGIKVKVNSVLIPGINDEHLAEVSRVVKEAGGSSHNIMPLIISPGSRFERDGRQAPDPELTLRVQEESARVMPVMRHCRQCRADAVGLLGEDRGGDVLSGLPVYTLEERENELQRLDNKLQLRRDRRQYAAPGSGGVRIAVATRGGGRVNLHFGHAEEFLVYEVEGEAARLLGVRKIQAYCNGTAACAGEDEGAGILKETIELLRDCQILLCAGIGTVPQEVLRKADIMAVVTKDEIESSLVKYGRLLSYFSPGAVPK